MKKKKELLTFKQSLRAEQKAEAARIPSYGVLGSETERGSNFAFIDRVVGRGCQQQSIGKASPLRPVDNQIPSAQIWLARWRFGRVNGHDPEDPSLTDGCLPLLARVHLARHHNLFAG